MAVYDVDGDEITGEGQQKHYCYSRDYTYINHQLVCERKDLDNTGALSGSTTRCVIHLPKNGLIEVRAHNVPVMFKVAKVSGATVTWLDTAWSYYTTRYMGDGTSDYYALVAKAPDGTAEITTAETMSLIAVYSFLDIGVRIALSTNLNGKSVAFIGDSITQGRFKKYDYSGGGWDATKPFGSLIAEMVKDMDYGNYGISGASLSGDAWKSVLTNRYKVNGYDVVFICAGTNDFGTNVQSATFTTALQTVIDTLKANNTEVVACTPVNRATATTPNSQGLTLLDYCNIIKEVSAEKGIKCIDLYTLTNDGVFITYCPDGLHPNEIGHKIIADLIIQQYEIASA